jgi:hypothetical protein
MKKAFSTLAKNGSYNTRYSLAMLGTETTDVLYVDESST